MSKRSLLIGVTASLGVTLVALSRVDAQELSGQGRAEAAGRSLIGSPAPSIVVETIDGGSIDLSALYGEKAVYLKFWATWCVPCRKQMPHFEHAYQTAGTDLAVIAVNAGFNDSREDVEAYRREVGITMPIVIDDGRLAAALNLRVTPQHVVIGGDGRIEYVGHLADERLDAALRAARTSVSTGEPQRGASVPISIAQREEADHLPDMSATTLDGGTFHARDASEKRPTVFVFMSPWCESYWATSRPAMATNCRQVREQVDSLARGDTRVRWIGVASGLWATRDELRDYQTRYETQIPLMLDETGAWFRSFQVTSVPTLLIADPDGRIVKRIVGFDANLPVELEPARGR